MCVWGIFVDFVLCFVYWLVLFPSEGRVLHQHSPGKDLGKHKQNTHQLPPDKVPSWLGIGACTWPEQMGLPDSALAAAAMRKFSILNSRDGTATSKNQTPEATQPPDCEKALFWNKILKCKKTHAFQRFLQLSIQQQQQKRARTVYPPPPLPSSLPSSDHSMLLFLHRLL